MQTSNIASGPEVMVQYATALGVKKAESPAWKLFCLGIVAGIMIAFGAIAASTASHAVENAGLARLISGLVFSIGLGMVMLMGSELFTGNTMILISVLDRQASVANMLRNWLIVYLGNLAGSVLLAAGIAYSGQLGLGKGALAVYVIKSAVGKCSLGFGPAVMLGIFCNILVCLGVLCSLTAKDTIGRIVGAYVPVALFIIGGFEHCVANMYNISVAIFALSNPQYAALATEAGLNTVALTWGNMFIVNLLPVTIGNIIGGAGIAVILWAGHQCRSKAEDKKVVQKV